MAGRNETFFDSVRFAFDINDIESSSNNDIALEKDEYRRRVAERI